MKKFGDARPTANHEQLTNRWAQYLLASVMLAFAVWYLVFLICGPRLAINHDELNYLYEALRLPAQRRLTGYAHGPLLYELIALVEVGWYAVLRLTHQVTSPSEFLTQVLAHEQAHLIACRAMVGLIALLLLVQVYRLGCLFGGSRVGALASLLCATNLTFISLTSLCKEDGLFWLLMVTAMLQTWRVVERRLARDALLAGLAIGAATVTKYFGVFALPLCVLPLICLPALEWRQSLKLGFIIALSAGVTTIALMPFIVTETSVVLASILGMSSSAAQAGGGLTLPTYLATHLTDLVGWALLVAGTVELVWRLFRQPRGPVLLIAAPLIQLLFLGLRPGHSMAYYIFPLALFLCVLASALAIRALDWPLLGRWSFAAPLLVVCVAVCDSAFLPGALKHAIILTGPDVRLLARDYLQSQAANGEGIAVTRAIVGVNVWGPPLLPLEPPAGANVFALAQAEALRRANGPRYRLRLFDGTPDLTPEMIRDCDWLITPHIGPLASTAGDGASDRATDGLAEFELARVIEPTPIQHSPLWPFLTFMDYEELRRASVWQLWRSRVRGLTMLIYRRRVRDGAVSPLPRQELLRAPELERKVESGR